MLPVTFAAKRPPQYEEVLVRVLPTREKRERTTPGVYDVFIYTRLRVAFSHAPYPLPHSQPQQLAGLPFAAKEHLRFDWKAFQGILRNAEVMGNWSSHELAMHLHQSLPAPLQSLLARDEPHPRPLRIWWSADEAPELEVLPWEAVVHQHGWNSHLHAFIRGSPPDETPPRVPLRDERLHMALIGDPAAAPGLPEALAAQKRFFPDRFVTHRISSPLHEALQQVVEEGYELIHLVADDIVAPGLHGTLRLGKYTISPGELRARLDGSRVMLLSLSLPAPPLPSTDRSLHTANDHLIKGTSVPQILASEVRALAETGHQFLRAALEKLRGSSAETKHCTWGTYQAYLRFASEVRGQTTLFAPMGPLTPPEVQELWTGFYAELAQGLSIEDSVSASLGENTSGPPRSLFLRHRLEQQFSREPAPETAPSIEPTAVHAELQASRRLLKKLERLTESQPRVSDALALEPLLDEERERQKEMEDLLRPWRSQEEQVLQLAAQEHASASLFRLGDRE